ncbi:MAG TPA: hypothetical protein VGK48_25655 [Terriglobia bacterium]|jgi:hypothetical protein
MPEASGEVLTFINQHYGTITAMRALAQWAGGSQDEIEFTGTVSDIWQRLWSKAADGGRRCSEFSIFREVLYDRPGDPQVLAFLTKIAAERFAESQKSASRAADAIETALAMSGIGNPIRAVLAAFPAQSWEAAFCCFAPVFEGKYSGEERQHLLQECAATTEAPTAEVARGLIAAVLGTHAHH